MERRTFLRSSSLATAALMTPSVVPSPPPEKIRLGIVGVGWWGIDFLLTFAQACGKFEIIGLCDVSEQALKTASTKLVEFGSQEPKLFADYQDLYDMSGLEAVAIASPTHWHALQFIAACDKGLDIWQEKPISYDIREAQAMQQAHQKADNVVNIDFPRLYAPFIKEVKDYIQSGQAGEIHQIDFNLHFQEGYPAIAEVPTFFDYETFCGPAPKVPFRLNTYRGGRPAWRAQHDFSRGILADWGIHYLQNIRTVMDLGLPNRVSAIGGVTRKDGRENPDHLTVNFDFEGLPVQWSQKTWGYTSPQPHTNMGVFYCGDKATIFANDSGWEVYPTGGGEMKSYGDTKMTFPGPKYMEEVKKIFVRQWNDFAAAIRTKSNKGIKGTFHEGHLTTACINYADFAYRSGQSVHIDHSTMIINNNDKAMAMMKRAYREGYRHPYVG